MIRKYFLLGVLIELFVTNFSYSQYSANGEVVTQNIIQTQVPFLTISPDARGGSMGDLGVATKPDLNSMHWNSAKYVFLDDDLGVSCTYTPWLKALTNDINLLYLTGFMRVDKQQVIAGAIRYFSLGSVPLTDINAMSEGTKNPNEFTLEGAYSRLFSDRLSGGITFRFIRSDLAVGTITSDNAPPSKAGIAFAADIGLYYHKQIELDKKPAEWAWGVNISNLGSKISYTDNGVSGFIPANLRIGTAFTSNLDSYNKLTVALDLNKLLVPTPPIKGGASGDSIIKGMSDQVSVPQGIFQSLWEAPGGFDEKIKEITESIGCEYLYSDQFALRCGYFNESAMKGNRKYFTLGLGLKMNQLSFDFSYLIPTSYSNNPLANTMRFTATYEVGKPKKQQNTSK